MRRLWTAAALAGIVLAAEAHADTVYLKNGETIWGRSISEEGNVVVIERPGGNLRIPKSEVDRIQPARTSIPRYYAPPEAPAAPPPPGAPLAPAPAAPGGEQGGTAEPAAPPGPEAPPAPTQGKTELPPPPPPPR